VSAPSIDRAAFAASVAILVAVCLPLAAFPESGGRVLGAAYEFIAREFGALYLAAGLGAIGLLAWLACGRYGRVLLGVPGDRPEFSTASWATMLFCSGIGAGLLFWAPVEWAYYYQSPPFATAPRTPAAADWASTYGIFHWGIVAWCFYCLPAVAIAYPYYTRRLPYLRFSTSCHYLVGAAAETRRGRFIDLLFMISLIGGAGSSLGFSTPMIAACIARLTGTDTGFGLEVLSLLLCVALFAVSVWFGLRKGIKRLSDINLWLAFALLAFVFFAGPTVFLLKASLNSIGVMLQNFIRMSTWTDAYSDSGFVESWTVFYWAWWIAYGPFVGLFVTRISRGRTIRQVILGMVGYGSLGCALFFMILGNYGLHLELAGSVSVTGILQSDGQPAAIVSVLDALPGAWPAIAVFTLVSIIFSATTYDSASYILASSATRDLRAGDEPARWHRLFWAMALAALPLTLMFIGGLRVIQTATLVVSLPLLVVGVLMSWSLVRQLASDRREAASGARDAG